MQNHSRAKLLVNSEITCLLQLKFVFRIHQKLHQLTGRVWFAGNRERWGKMQNTNFFKGLLIQLLSQKMAVSQQVSTPSYQTLAIT